MTEVKVGAYGVNYHQIAGKLSLEEKRDDADWIDHFNRQSETIIQRAHTWCRYHNVSMRIVSLDFALVSIDGDKVPNTVEVTVCAENVVISEIAAAVGVSGPLLKITELIPDDLSAGLVSGIINMNKRLISSEGVKLLARKGIDMDDISVRMLKCSEAAMAVK